MSEPDLDRIATLDEQVRRLADAVARTEAQGDYTITYRLFTTLRDRLLGASICLTCGTRILGRHCQSGLHAP